MSIIAAYDLIAMFNSFPGDMESKSPGFERWGSVLKYISRGGIFCRIEGVISKTVLCLSVRL